jgi:hypothetical protein
MRRRGKTGQSAHLPSPLLPGLDGRIRLAVPRLPSPGMGALHSGFRRRRGIAEPTTPAHTNGREGTQRAISRDPSGSANQSPRRPPNGGTFHEVGPSPLHCSGRANSLRFAGGVAGVADSYFALTLERTTSCNAFLTPCRTYNLGETAIPVNKKPREVEVPCFREFLPLGVVLGMEPAVFQGTCRA